LIAENSVVTLVMLVEVWKMTQDVATVVKNAVAATGKAYLYRCFSMASMDTEL